jgi:hypothetical protein
MNDCLRLWQSTGGTGVRVRQARLPRLPPDELSHAFMADALLRL